MDTNLFYLTRKIRRRFERVLRKRGALSEALYDLTPAYVHTRHHCKLKTDALVYSEWCRQSPKQNRIIWEELEKMLKEFLIVSATFE